MAPLVHPQAPSSGSVGSAFRLVSCVCIRAHQKPQRRDGSFILHALYAATGPLLKLRHAPDSGQKSQTRPTLPEVLEKLTRPGSPRSLMRHPGQYFRLGQRHDEISNPRLLGDLAGRRHVVGGESTTGLSSLGAAPPSVLAIARKRGKSSR